MSFITMISIAGIALGVTALIVVLSVMNGFQKEIRGQLLNVAPHAEIGYYDVASTPDWQNLREFVKGKKEVLASAPLVSDQALLANSGEVRGAQISGILPTEEKNVVDYGKNMPTGSFDDLKPGEFNIILGQVLAQELGAEVGGKVTVITPDGNVTPAGVVPRLKQFNVVGIVKTGVYEADKTSALIHIQDARVLYRLDENFGALRLRLADPQNAPSFTAKLIPDAKKDEVWVRDWTFNNRSYFEAVELEKRMMFIILTLIIAVATFNPRLVFGNGSNGKTSRYCDFAHVGFVSRRRHEDFLGTGCFRGILRYACGRGMRCIAGLECRQDCCVFLKTCLACI